MDRMISNTSKKPSCVDLQDVLVLYPNISYFHEKYCKDCGKGCSIPSIQIFSCMIQKLTKKEEDK